MKRYYTAPEIDIEKIDDVVTTSLNGDESVETEPIFFKNEASTIGVGSSKGSFFEI